MRHKKSLKGASLAEYGLLAGLVSVTAIAAVTGAGERIRNIFGESSDLLSAELTASEPRPANQAPDFITAAALPNFDASTPFTAKIEASDHEADPITYTLEPDAPEWLVMDPETGEATEATPRPPVMSVLFSVRASDTSGASSTRTFHATRNNSRPAFVSGPDLGEVDYAADLASLDVSASDPEGDEVSYALANAPDYLEIDHATGALSAKRGARPVYIDTLDFDVIATDAAGATTTRNFFGRFTLPESCDEIFQARQGDIASGIYQLDTDGDNATPIWAQCYMIDDAEAVAQGWSVPEAVGGWTAVARQEEGEPQTNWNAGVAGAPQTHVDGSYTLSQGELPAHAMTGFGRQTAGGLFEMVDAVAHPYQTGNIDLTGSGTTDRGNLLSAFGTGNRYDIHRETAWYFPAHDPDWTGVGNDGKSNTHAQWFNTLTFDLRPTPATPNEQELTWSFSPNGPEPIRRGYAYDGVSFATADAGFAWMVFVK